MRVAMYYSNSDVRLEEMPRPRIGPDELLMKVMASGICGSDVMEWYRLSKAPRVLGHEVTGVVEEAGSNVGKYQVGDRIFATHHVPCGECHYCRDRHETLCDTLRRTSFDPGGFSEYVRIPSINVERGVFHLPLELSFEQGTFIEPLACVVRGQRIAEVKQHHTTLILGSGVAGLLHIRLAKANKVRRVIATDLNEYRLKAAERSGADKIIDAQDDVPQIVRELNGDRLADRVIVCTGSMSASRQALKSIDRGGTVLFFAAPQPGEDISVPINNYWLNEISLTSSYGASPADLMESLELLRTHSVEVEDMITHRLPLAETVRGFRLVAEATQSLKVIVQPQR